jgi:hypothetical protein
MLHIARQGCTSLGRAWLIFGECVALVALLFCSQEHWRITG